jgi:hypothetical protein
MSSINNQIHTSISISHEKKCLHFFSLSLLEGQQTRNDSESVNTMLIG